MRAETAAAYMDEVSVEAFLRKVPAVYPRPITSKGERRKWDKEELDRAATLRAPGNSKLAGVPSLAEDL